MCCNGLPSSGWRSWCVEPLMLYSNTEHSEANAAVSKRTVYTDVLRFFHSSVVNTAKFFPLHILLYLSQLKNKKPRLTKTKHVFVTIHVFCVVQKYLRKSFVLDFKNMKTNDMAGLNLPSMQKSFLSIPPFFQKQKDVLACAVSNFTWSKCAIRSCIIQTQRHAQIAFPVPAKRPAHQVMPINDVKQRRWFCPALPLPILTYSHLYWTIVWQTKTQKQNRVCPTLRNRKELSVLELVLRTTDNATWRFQLTFLNSMLPKALISQRVDQKARTDSTCPVCGS